MEKLTRQEKHEQCMREIRGTLIVVLICCAWHIASAFLLNGTGLYFLGMPAWFSVSTFGTIILSLIGVWYLLNMYLLILNMTMKRRKKNKCQQIRNHSCNFYCLPRLKCCDRYHFQ